MTLEVLFARAAQGRAFLLLTAAGVALGVLLAMEMRNGELRTRQLENDNRALQRQASRLKTGEQRRQEEMTLLKRELALQLYAKAKETVVWLRSFQPETAIPRMDEK